jgi:hypothetical protein
MRSTTSYLERRFNSVSLQQSIRTTPEQFRKLRFNISPIWLQIFLSDSLTSCLLAKKSCGKPDHRKSCWVSHHGGEQNSLSQNFMRRMIDYLLQNMHHFCYSATKKFEKSTIWNEKSRVHC